MMDTLDYSKLCRLCLSQDRPLLKIFQDSETIESYLSCIASKIKDCLGIEVEIGDNFPDQICNCCLDEVENWVKFKELCDNANSILIQYSTGIPPLPDEVLEKNLQRNNSDNLDILPEGSCDFGLGDVSLLDHDSLFDGFGDCKEENIPVNEHMVKKSFLSLFKENSDDPKDNNDEEQVIKVAEEVGLKEKNRSKWREKYSRVYMKKYTCEICSQDFSKLNLLLKHDRIDHRDVAVTEKCDKCSRSFISKNRLDIHVRMNHRDKLYECDVCRVKCATNKSLKVHKMRHSGRFVCDVCGLANSTHRMLQDHKAVHMEGPARPQHTCSTCKRNFKFQQTLREHLKTHMTEMQPVFKCDLCSQIFSKLEYLKKHNDTHSMGKSAICDECGAVLKNTMSLYNHKLKHKERRHSCPICDRMFHTNHLVKRHMSVHGLQSYTCTICKKSFTRSDSYAMHLKTHQIGQQFDCEHCDRSFTLQRYLRRHISRIHRKEDEL